MANVKYRQRFPGGKWKSYGSPSEFNKNAEFYTDIIKNYDELPSIAVYHIGFCRHNAAELQDQMRQQVIFLLFRLQI